MKKISLSVLAILFAATSLMANVDVPVKHAKAKKANCTKCTKTKCMKTADCPKTGACPNKSSCVGM
ncbi:MAG: hypothetical protein ACXVAY_17520 [Mucilaginibacter sp.]